MSAQIAKQTKDTNIELPTGWRWVRLSEVTTVVNGTTPESENPSFWNGDIVWITPTDLGKLLEPYIRNSDRKITTAGLDSRNLTRVPLRSIILSSRAPIGHLGIAAVELCTNQGCKSFIPKEDVDEWFLYYALKRSVWKLQQLGSGATFSEISKTQLENFSIPFPPFSEQRRIAGMLREQMVAVDKARAAAQARFEAVKTLPASILREAFLPAQIEQWGVKCVDEIASLVIDGPHVTPSYVPQGVPFVTVKNIQSGHLDFRELSYITEEDHRQFSRRGRAERGDILYTKDGTLGIPCVVDTDEEFGFFVSVALIKLRRDVADPEFVAYAMMSRYVIHQVDRLGAGAGLKHMVLKSIRALMIPCPSLKEQRRIAAVLREHLAAVEKVRAAAEIELQTINALPATLLRQAFNGEL